MIIGLTGRIATGKGEIRRILEKKGFLEIEERDFGEEDINGQQVGKCMEESDFLIFNEDRLTDFENKVKSFLREGGLKC